MILVSKIFSYVLILAASVNLCWGLLGFIEYFSGAALILPLQNPTFPGGTQLIHWFLITVSGAVFLLGYFTKWRYTPFAMVVIYAMLATLCAVETFDFMTNPSRYVDFIVEVISYILISIYLFRSQRMRLHFGFKN